jgi:hypothetical protein
VQGEGATHLAEALHGHPGPLEGKAPPPRQLQEDPGHPVPGGVVPALGAPQGVGLPRDHPGHRGAHGHGVGVHDPGHGLLVRAYIGAQDVHVGADQVDELGGVAPHQPLQLPLGKGLGVHGHPARRAAKGQVVDGRLQGHPGGQARRLPQGDRGVKAHPPFGGPSGDVVDHPVALEDPHLAVVHDHGQGNGDQPLGVGQILHRGRVDLRHLQGFLQKLQEGVPKARIVWEAVRGDGHVLTEGIIPLGEPPPFGQGQVPQGLLVGGVGKGVQGLRRQEGPLPDPGLYLLRHPAFPG